MSSTKQTAEVTRVVASRRRPRAVEEKLKPDRVQEPLTVARVEQRLKAERVQERLKGLPGWKVAQGGRAIDRVRSFPTSTVAASYAAYVVERAGCSRQPVEIAVSAGQVAITLHCPRASGGLTEAVLDLAADLG